MKKLLCVILASAILMTVLLWPLEASAAMSSDAVSWYRSKLYHLHDHFYDGGMGPLDERSSKFALIDIDGDGVDELIARLFGAGMVSAAGRIYCYDKAKSTISECEIGHYISGVYKNGYIKVDASHNHSPGDTIWPYSVYRYDTATKTTTTNSTTISMISPMKRTKRTRISAKTGACGLGVSVRQNAQ